MENHNPKPQQPPTIPSTTVRVSKNPFEPIKKYLNSISDDERKKIISYAYIALTLFALSFFGFFAISPTLSTISNLNKQYDDNQLTLTALNNKLANLQSLDTNYKQIQEDLPSIYNAIPKTTEIPQLARQLENIAGDSNVSVAKLSFGTVEIYPNIKVQPIYSFTFTIDVIGDRNNVNGFIGNVINFDRIIGIDRIVTGQDQEGRYTGEITGRAYFLNK